MNEIVLLYFQTLSVIGIGNLSFKCLFFNLNVSFSGTALMSSSLILILYSRTLFYFIPHSKYVGLHEVKSDHRYVSPLLMTASITDWKGIDHQTMPNQLTFLCKNSYFWHKESC